MNIYPLPKFDKLCVAIHVIFAQSLAALRLEFSSEKIDRSRNTRGNLMLLLMFILLQANLARAELPMVAISLPGPGGAAYVPIDLIPLIGADKAEGLQVRLLHVSGGGLALNNLNKRNVDFAVLGLPAFMSQRSKDIKVVALASSSDLPVLVLLARADLKKKIKTVADLKGRTVGVTTSSLSSKTVTQQLTEQVLRNAGIALEDVRLVATGYNWEETIAMVQTKSVDAIMTDATFAARMLAEGSMFTLLNLGDPVSASKIPGGRYLHATLGTREELLQQQPQLAEKMVRILQRSLAWIASHSPEQIVEKLGISDDQERKALLSTLKTYPHMFSRDGKFSAAQLRETEVFFRNANPDDPAAQSLQLKTMIDDRWAGSKP